MNFLKQPRCLVRVLIIQVWLLYSTASAQVPTVTVSLSALATGFEADNAAVYYSKSSPAALSNDGGAATGGFRIFNVDGGPKLTPSVHQKTGRSKFVHPVYDIDGRDYLVTIASPDSILRLFSSDGTHEVQSARKYVLGDWSTLCTWRSNKSGLQYLFLLGKKQVVQFLIKGRARAVEILEVQTFPIPIEGEFCTATTSGRIYFSGENAPLYSFDVLESTVHPTINVAREGLEVYGLGHYAGSKSSYVLIAGENIIAVYSDTLSEIGVIEVSGVSDLSIEGNLGIFQGSTTEHPNGFFVIPLEGDDDVVGVGIGSLTDALQQLKIAPNTAFDPHAASCRDCQSTLCQKCSGSGFCLKGTGGNGGGCECFSGFAGSTCKKVVCKNECSSRGKCVGPNECKCNKSWAGPDCSFLLVKPKYETDANGGDGDDPAIWISPSSPVDSRIVTTTKSGESTGLGVFDLSGKLLQTLPAGEPNNVDIIYSFKVGNRTTDLAFAACREDNTLCFFEINPQGNVSNIAGGVQPTEPDYEVYGSCVYRSRKSGKQYVFVNSQDATYLQYELTASSDGVLETKMVRSFMGGSGGQTEGCVADEENGFIFIGEEPTGLWRYDAEPDTDGSKGFSVAKVGDGRLSADVEGITLVPGKGADEGFIFVSSQGVSAYLVYRRAEPHEYVMSFTIGDSKDGSIDHVSNTDGITAVGNYLNKDFPHGLFVTHDDANELAAGGTATTASFKLVSLSDILNAEAVRGLGLEKEVDKDFDPRSL